MNLQHLLVKTCTVRHRAYTAQDRYNKTLTETGTNQYDCWAEQTDAREVVVGRELQTADWLLVLPKGALIGPLDLVDLEGQTFEVVGPPNRTVTPRGEHHVEAHLRHFTG